MDVKVELLLGVLENITHTAGFLAIVSGIAIPIVGMGYLMSSVTAANGSTSYRAENAVLAPILKRYLQVLFGIFFVTVLLAMVPDTDHMFRIRLNLIKFQLASPENVQKSTDEILEIAKQLECRYLGCPSEAKKVDKK